ncbi:MAG: hypothetical protein P8X68_21010 [Desulfobacterales bacterium]
MKAKKHIITMRVENKSEVTARVSGLFASRRYNSFYYRSYRQA